MIPDLERAIVQIEHESKVATAMVAQKINAEKAYELYIERAYQIFSRAVERILQGGNIIRESLKELPLYDDRLLSIDRSTRRALGLAA